MNRIFVGVFAAIVVAYGIFGPAEVDEPARIQEPLPEISAPAEPPIDILTEPAAPSFVKLKAGLSTTGLGSVILENRSDRDWNECRVELNAGFFDSGFVFSAGTLSAESSYEVGLLQFADGDGLRFDPSQRKVQKASIVCDDVEGALGTFTGAFK